MSDASYVDESHLILLHLHVSFLVGNQCVLYARRLDGRPPCNLVFVGLNIAQIFVCVHSVDFVINDAFEMSFGGET